jgi:ankyrin repeat protein
MKNRSLLNFLWLCLGFLSIPMFAQDFASALKEKLAKKFGTGNNTAGKTYGPPAGKTYGPTGRTCQPIHDAAKAGDINAVSKLLASGVDVNTKGCFWMESPLHMAIEQQASVELKSNFWEPLSIVIHLTPQDETRILAMVKFLIQHGADINYKTKDFEKTALQLAVEANLSQVAETLLSAGADANCVMVDGSTPVITAAKMGFVGCLSALMNHGANVLKPLLDDRMNPDPRALAIHIAAYFNKVDSLELLLTKTGVNQTDALGSTALHYAAQSLALPAATFLISKGANKTIKNKAGKTPLGEAADAITAQKPKISKDQLLQEPMIRALQY